MRRTRDWIKFGLLIGTAAVLAVGFTSILDLPKDSQAQPVPGVSLASLPLPQKPVVPEAQPLADLGNAFTAVAEAVRSAVVFIRVEERQENARSDMRIPPGMERFFQMPEEGPRVRQGSGSGFVISNDGYIITNSHVVQGADRVDVTLFDQRQFEARVVGYDPLTDVAVIKVDADDVPAVAMGNSDAVRVGEWVMAVGNPLGQEFSFTVTAGIVSGRGRRLGGLRPQQGAEWSIHDFIQTDAAINRGNSGGPLVNIAGEVIGVNSAIASETGVYAGYGFAIPINLVRNVADQLISSGKVTRAQLGVSISDVDPEVAEYVGLAEIRGVQVQGFSNDNSPAARAGLKPGDVIVEVDGEKVLYTAQLQQLVGFKRPGETVDVTILRKGGERHTYAVRLREADTEAEQTVARARPEDIEEAGKLEPRLGVALEPFGRDAAARYGFGSGVTGLAVVDVDRDGPARDKLNASIPERGFFEIITEVNDQRVRTRDDLSQALRGVRPGQVVPLRVTVPASDGEQSRLVYIRIAAGT
jgi:serine protease Do